jgi:hypothetical protein
MANIKSFWKKQFSFLVIGGTIFGIFSFKAYGNISPLPKTETNPQMINLNMQFKAKSKIIKSDLSMPFYQTAEIEKKFDKKTDILVEVNPRYGKNGDEVAIEMKFYKESGAKAFAKREVVAKFGEETKVKVKGMSVKITPTL